MLVILCGHMWAHWPLRRHPLAPTPAMRDPSRPAEILGKSDLAYQPQHITHITSKTEVTMVQVSEKEVTSDLVSCFIGSVPLQLLHMAYPTEALLQKERQLSKQKDARNTAAGIGLAF